MKNVGGDYPRLFAPHISRVFIGTYELSSEDVKRKLKHLLKTWEEAAMFSSEVRKATRRVAVIVGGAC
jgi:hypothetical protein